MLALLVVAAPTGCRMCGSPYDYCMPAYTQRSDDYRGCDPLYRAGSIFYANVDYADGFDDPNCPECSKGNTGNFGKTRSILGPRARQPERTPRTRTTTPPPPIGIPLKAPVSNGNGTPDVPQRGNQDYRLPTIEELLDETRPDRPFGPTTPAVPVTPPSRRPVPPPVPSDPSESIPFTMQSGEPTISLDELRRLDPSITDVKILNIDDKLNAPF